MKIAITSNEGKYIDTHFGKAERILIYEINDSGHTLLEVKNIEKYCSEDPHHKFSHSKFDVIYNEIKGCSKLYTQKIGPAVAEKFLAKGIVAKITDCEIEKVLKIQ